MQVKIAVVGEGSRQVLSAEGAPDLLNIAFTPSKVKIAAQTSAAQAALSDECVSLRT